MNRWFRKLIAKRQSDPRRAVSRRPSRLAVEVLEQREVLSGFYAGSPPGVYDRNPLSGASLTAIPPVANSDVLVNTLLPIQAEHAYGFDQIGFLQGSNYDNRAGQGETIAIVMVNGDPYLSIDLDVFDRRMGLPAPPNFQVVNQTGGANLPAPFANDNGELAYDVEWAHAIAPAAKILVVEPTSLSSRDLSQAIDYARNQPGVAAVSMSFGQGGLAGQDGLFTTPAGHQGVTFVASSGDSGNFNYPAASPNVLAVGGTNLSLGADEFSYGGETGWSGSGGGADTSQATPLYQRGLVVAGRGVPDVSYAASNFAFYDTFNGQGWMTATGTSAGAPQWAALVAIADQARALNGLPSLDGASQTLPTLYELGRNGPNTFFHDITSVASNTGLNVAGLSAGIGYDQVTGLGTPRANLLVDALSTSTVTDRGGEEVGTVQEGLHALPSPVFTLSGDRSQANQNDNVVVGATAQGGVEVTLNGVTTVFAPGALTTINLSLGGGSNTVQVNALPAGMTLNLDNWTSGHNDTVTVGDTSSSLASVAGTVNVSNGSGNTSVTVDDYGDAQQARFAVSSNAVQYQGRGLVNYSGDVRGLSVRSGMGGTVTDVNSTAANVPVTVLTELGTNQINVHASNSTVNIQGIVGTTDNVVVGANGSLASVAGAVNLSNSSARTSLTVDDAADSSFGTYAVMNNAVSFQGRTVVSYNNSSANVSDLTLETGFGGSLTDVLGTPSAVPLTLDTGRGSNSVNVHKSGGTVNVQGAGGTDQVVVGADGSLAGINGPVNVSNGSNPYTGAQGKSSVIINDSNDTATRNLDISSTAVTFEGLTTVNLLNDVTGVKIMEGQGFVHTSGSTLG